MQSYDLRCKFALSTNLCCVIGPWVVNSLELFAHRTCIVYILVVTLLIVCLVCLNVNIDLFDFLTGTLVALAHCLSFALLVVGIPLR